MRLRGSSALWRLEVERSPAGTTRRADLLVTSPGGHQVAVEVQASRISADEMEDRTRDYHAAGVDVAWVVAPALMANGAIEALLWISQRARLWIGQAAEVEGPLESHVSRVLLIRAALDWRVDDPLAAAGLEAWPGVPDGTDDQAWSRWARVEMGKQDVSVIRGWERGKREEG